MALLRAVNTLLEHSAETEYSPNENHLLSQFALVILLSADLPVEM
jgi:hypothetical protein